MFKICLKNPEAFIRSEENSTEPCYGCEQEWYQSDWQKRSGCGPTTACNLLSYIEFSKVSSDSKVSKISKEHGLLRMQESWEYVTPSEKGIPTTKMFCDDFLNYAKAKGMNLSYHSVDVNGDGILRPDFRDIIKFIEMAMINDSPVAFLNLCNGEVSNLDRWHWVTIISIEYDNQTTEAYIDILDEGLIKNVDLKLWYDTTTLGGGFAYFESV